MAKPDEPGFYKKEDLLRVDWDPPKKGWIESPVDFRHGTYIYPGKAKNLKVLDLPHARDWAVLTESVDTVSVLRI